MTEIPQADGPITHSERLKVEYDFVMQALYRDMKRFCTPGVESGISEVAELIERSEHSLRNQFGPTCYDHAPTAYEFLHVIDAIKSREAVAAIAALADCTTIPRAPRAKEVGAPSDLAQAFAGFERVVDRELRATQARLQAGRTLTVSERTEAREALFNIAAYTAYLITRVR